MKCSNGNKKIANAALFGALAMLGACDGGDSRSRREIRGPATATQGGTQAGGGVKKLDPATAGTIAGTVKWTGAKTSPEKIDVSGNPDCVKISKETIYDEKLVVNGNDTVRNVFVFVDTPDSYEVPAEPVVIDQIGCRYTPHAFAVQAGQSLKIKSTDATTHNVHFIPSGDLNEEENFGMNPGQPAKTRTFAGPDWIKFKCEVHPWMNAWCLVRNHPFMAITGEDGTYTIKNVPPGTHKLVMKHEKLGEQTASVTVETGKTVSQDFTLK